ncbi:MAG: hypothetical protein AAF371_02365 [Pseudomonadota bacterium]
MTVVEDKKLGLTAEIHPQGGPGAVSEQELEKVLGSFARPWRLAD